MKTAHLVTSELFFIFLLAGCANLPPDEACRAGLEKEREVYSGTNVHTLIYHRSPNFVALLSEAEINELNGDYQSCLNNLSAARQSGYGHGYGHGDAGSGYNNEKQHIDKRNTGGHGGPGN
jgi:hypothetical protein